MADWLSPAQLLGYLAFALGLACFAQKDDLRFKLFMAGECAAYALHFWLLGEPTAVASTLVSLGRSLASIRSRSPWVALVFIGLSAGLGAWLFQGWASLLPITASIIGTSALFFLQGLRMRLLMLVGTGLWVANNLLVGSIGGSLLELTLLATNSWTIGRMWREQRQQAQAATG
ncbi:YgjV family protein [Pelomonas sp. V22]|uniref:YgjV family protein n=1 Tax=Pelomonas sp. V22 TaxID=2822139 RepID=UPI0024A8BA57|nr:YgjV family protein [Pelomonas sp. V22]MDI4635015.1 YgjV family protein [Pelomonas sp. V22]